jgi:hypothetical protein
MGCSFIPAEPEEIQQKLEDVLNDLQGDEVQVVAASYAGPAGIDSINQYFHGMNAIGKPTFGQFAQGDPCIWTDQSNVVVTAACDPELPLRRWCCLYGGAAAWLHHCL